MKPYRIQENIKIDHIVPGGQGLGTLASGQKIFLWNALPHEIISECEIWRRKTHYLEGVAVQHIKTSPARLAPRDEIFLSTSPWQIMDFATELELKNRILEDIWRQHDLPIKDCAITPIQTDGREWQYRNKMEYSLYYDHATSQISLSFHRRGTHQKVPILKSSIERPELFQRAQQILNQMQQDGLSARDFQSLLLRTNALGKVSGGLLKNHCPHPVFPNLQDYILGQPFSYSPNGFFQVNLPVYELALDSIKNALARTGTAKVLDLYAGVGSIGLSVVSSNELTLVEVDQSAFRALELNCVTFTRSDFHPRAVLAKAEDVTSFISPDTTVIMDPPRAGCDCRMLEALNTIRPAQIIYMSCDPVTQARDLKILSAHYNITRIIPFNFFPKTPHVESVVLMSRAD